MVGEDASAENNDSDADASEERVREESAINAPAERAGVRDRIEEGADRAIEGFDEGVIELLSWILDTETRARIYIHLRQHPDSTSEEIAEGTGLYPSTVREALAELHEEGRLTRGKRENDGAGNNPYEYSAIPPSDLVADMVGEVQSQLNTLFNLDRVLGGGSEDAGDEPVTITVDGEGEQRDDRSDRGNDES